MLTLNDRTYRLYGKPFKVETSIDVDFANRRPKDLNMIMFTAEEVLFSQDVYTNATGVFLATYIDVFQYTISAIAAMVAIVLMLCIYVVIKFSVVNPVLLLTNFILQSENNNEIEPFIEVVLSHAERKQKRLESLVRR